MPNKTQKYKENLTKGASYKNVRHLFWEFYLLEYLYFRLHNNPLINGRLKEKINERFEIVTNTFLNLTRDSLERSIRSEMKYVFRVGSSLLFDAINTEEFEREWDDYGTVMGYDGVIGKRALRNLNKYLKGFGQFKIDRGVSSKTAPIEWGKIAFKWPGWSSSYCGNNWAQACDTYLESRKVNSQKDKIMWIDRCLDLYHNNGFLLNKTEFAVLEQVGDLNERNCLQSWAPAAKDKSDIEEYVENEEGEGCTIKQKLFPFSTFTRGITVNYERFL
jgi:hypothetical protein